MRRIILGTLIAVAALGLAKNAGGQPSPEKLKALLITGGGFHDYAKINPVLVEKLQALAHVAFDVKSGLGTLKNPNFADSHDIVIYNFCFADEKDGNLIENALKVTRNGKPTMMVHCAMHTFQASDDWTDCCGMRTRKHDPYRTFSIIKTELDHPIVMRLPKDWRTSGDELYQTIKLGDRSTALLRGKADKVKSDHVVCWISTYGKGKVFATTLGHDMKTVDMPEYHQLLANGLLWACEKLDKDGKPMAGYGGTGGK